MIITSNFRFSFSFFVSVWLQLLFVTFFRVLSPKSNRSRQNITRFGFTNNAEDLKGESMMSTVRRVRDTQTKTVKNLRSLMMSAGT